VASPLCQWRSGGREFCGRQAYGDHEYCIFHLPEKKEDEIREFAKALVEEIELQRGRDSNTLNFRGFHFPRGINLLDMLGAKHGAPPTIEQELYFTNCTFDEAIVAEGTQFLGNVTFGESRFREGVSFLACTFKGVADFCRATFDRDAWFSTTQFQEATFTSTRFGDCSMFPDCEFVGDASFPNAVFQDDSSFMNSTFKAGALFHGAKFRKEVSFETTTFEGNAVFDPVEFSSTADFTGSTFLKDLEMKPWPQQQAGSTVLLSFTRFAQRVIFDLTEFLESSSTASTLLVLGQCVLEGQARMTFRGSMGCVSLLDTDLTNAVFVGEDWRPRPDLAGSVKSKKRNAVLEEYALERIANGETDIPELLAYVDVDGIAQLYRRLRDNYETHKRYAEAGDFFIGEMEILRRYRTVHTRVNRPPTPQADMRNAARRPLTDPYRFLLLEPYRILALYGESIRRPAFAALLIVLVFALVRPPLPLMLGSVLTFAQSTKMVTDTNLPTNMTGIINATWNALQESTFAFFQLRAENHTDLAERLFSAPILGLLFIAIRRKLERR
jgi:uncharacterized protein YjbI with pentapeptide repeats